MAQAGGISIHHCLTLHGSPSNHSGLPRRGVVFEYRAGHAYQMADHVWVDTGFQVHGTPSGRVKCEALDILLPKHRSHARSSGDPYGSVYAQLGAHARRWNAEVNAHKTQPEHAIA